jgi:hypothetical protein
MIPHGLENLHVIDEAARRKSFEISQRGGGGVDSKTEGGPDGSGDKKKRKWGVGELDFEALMRMLDNAVSKPLKLWPGNTKEGSIAVPLTSYLTGLESAV